MEFNIVTCGVGGQGLMLVSNILGVVCAEVGLTIKTAETHGLAQRSGPIYTHIRIGPQVFSSLIPYGEANVLLGLEAIETLRNIEFLNPDGLIILNDYIWYPVQTTFTRVQNPERPYTTINEIITQLNKLTSKIHIIDALGLAKKAGNALTSNVVLLGALSQVEGFPVHLDQIEKLLPQLVPAKAVDANIKALKLGAEALRFSIKKG